MGHDFGSRRFFVSSVTFHTRLIPRRQTTLSPSANLPCLILHWHLLISAAFEPTYVPCSQACPSLPSSPSAFSCLSCRAPHGYGESPSPGPCPSPPSAPSPVLCAPCRTRLLGEATPGCRQPCVLPLHPGYLMLLCRC